MTITALLISVFATAGFTVGWKVSENRFTQPVDVPLNCDNGGSPSYHPAQPQ